MANTGYIQNFDDGEEAGAAGAMQPKNYWGETI